MTLHLKASRRILLHIVGNFLNLSHRLRQQISLACLEKDIVSHELTRLGNSLLNGRHVCSISLIKILSTFGNDHMAYAAIGIFAVVNVVFKTTGSLHIRKINDTVAVDIVLKSTLIKRNGKVIPLA